MINWKKLKLQTTTLKYSKNGLEAAREEQPVESLRCRGSRKSGSGVLHVHISDRFRKITSSQHNWLITKRLWQSTRNRFKTITPKDSTSTSHYRKDYLEQIVFLVTRRYWWKNLLYLCKNLACSTHLLHNSLSRCRTLRGLNRQSQNSILMLLKKSVRLIIKLRKITLVMILSLISTQTCSALNKS